MPDDSTDGRGLRLTAAAAACDAYRRGVRAMLHADVGAEVAFDEAIALDPDFALAHVGRARLLWLRGELAAARAAATRARALTSGLDRRERQHVAVIALTVEGRPVEALAAAREHLAEFPRDAMVIAPCTNVFGLYGFSGRAGWERDLATFLDGLAPEWADDGWFLSLHAFALGELGDHDRARRLIERSLALAPRNGHGAHAMAHLLYESDRPKQTIAFLSEWLPEYPAAAQFHVHLHWHLALALLRAGEADAAWRVYRAAVHAFADRDGPRLNVLSDSAAFLWRSELSGRVAPPTFWQDVVAFGSRWFPQPGLAFADVHVAMALAAVGERAMLASLADTLDEHVAAGRLPAGAVIPAMVRAFDRARAGDAAAAVGCLQPVLAQIERLGGSRAQRDLPAWVCLRAAQACGREDIHQAMLADPRLCRLEQPPPPEGIR